MKTPQLVTCHCQQCNGVIQFDPTTFSGDNNMIVCPHCALRTVVAAPAAAARAKDRQTDADRSRLEMED